MKKILVVAAPLLLSACGGPVELTVAKLAGDLISYVTTGKSTTDHAVSVVADRDCALHRPLFSDDVCKDDDTILAEQASALAVMGEPEIKQEIRTARPEIYAVNAPAEDWSRPASPSSVSKTVIKTDLPPRAPEAKAAETVSEPVSEVKVAAASDELPSRTMTQYARTNDPLNVEAEANAAIAGYVPTESPADVAGETKTAALVDTTIMSDTVERATKPVETDANGDAMAGDVLTVPLPGEYVVLASFSNQARAHSALELYHEYQPRLISAKVKGRDFLRVAVGPLSAEHANDLRLLAAKKGVKDPWIVGIAPTGE
ncbi:SPOR domain-containing protein [Thalassospira lucentensis]|uniref:SPOR domain-containing protein n=1 Tax=Thalassospira lucentensis TaxID=168935 RepID=UPI003D2841FE